MALKLLEEKGTPLERQRFKLRELAPTTTPSRACAAS